jgi:hypothetical protein
MDNKNDINFDISDMELLTLVIMIILIFIIGYIFWKNDNNLKKN